ncbi:MAG: hypothetical protein R2825_17900 [Saprospiraceae bacterium]
MTTKFSLSFLAIGLSFLIYACTNDETGSHPLLKQQLGSLGKNRTDTGLINAIGAQVILYESEENRRDDVKETTMGQPVPMEESGSQPWPNPNTGYGSSPGWPDKVFRRRRHCPPHSPSHRPQ